MYGFLKMDYGLVKWIWDLAKNRLKVLKAVEVSGFQYLNFIFCDKSMIYYKESVIHYKESVIHYKESIIHYGVRNYDDVPTMSQLVTDGQSSCIFCG